MTAIIVLKIANGLRDQKTQAKEVGGLNVNQWWFYLSHWNMVQRTRRANGPCAGFWFSYPALVLRSSNQLGI
jgi:hypothetical protein